MTCLSYMPKLQLNRQVIMLLFFFFANFSITKGQIYTETYGQNRVQYRKFNWRYFETQHFRVYHYDAAGRHLARYVAEQAEKDIRIIEQKMSGKFPERFNIILYNNYDEYLQTNVGRKYESQIQDIPTGMLNLAGDRLVVYFTGVHTDLRRQLRAGMSKVVMERMIFGENFKEMVKNAIMLNLPDWVVNGFIAYTVDGWDTKSETDWKNLLQAYPNKGFFFLSEKNSELAGKAFWKYVSEKHGESNVKNLLYTIQLKSNLDEGVALTLGQTLEQTFDSVVNYYKKIYISDAQVQEHPDSVGEAILSIDIPKDNTQLRSFRVSPKGYSVAYVVWKDGEFQVILQYTEANEKKRILLEGGNKDYNEVPDPNYPLLAWSNDGTKLAIIYPQGRKLKMRVWNSYKARIQNYTIPANRFDRIQGVTFMEDDNFLVFSAVKKSKTDLYEFRIKGSKVTPITNDAWDDQQPWFVSGGSRRGVVFLSNRPEPNLNVPIKVNELPTGAMNAYFYDTKTQRPELLRLSSMDKGTLTQPIQYGGDNFAFLYDSNGIVNKYLVVFDRDKNNKDSAYAVPISNYSQSIIAHQYNPMSKQAAEVIQVGDYYNVYWKPVILPNNPKFQIKELKRTTLSLANDVVVAPVTSLNTVIPQTEQPSNYQAPVLDTGDVFQTEFDNTIAKTNPNKEGPKEITKIQDDVKENTAAESDLIDLIEPELYDAADTTVDSILVDSTYVKMKAMPYRLSFKPDFFSVKLDNSILFNKYQSLDQNINQSLGGMLSISLNDALENHRFTGGYRMPLSFNGSAFFLQYENVARRNDWGILYLRTTNSYNYRVDYYDTSGVYLGYNTQTGKLISNLLQGSLSHPFDRRRSIRFTMAFRQDKFNFKAKDYLSLRYETGPENIYWNMTRAEYIYDNTHSPAINILFGLRWKFYGEYFFKLSQDNGGFFNVGTDIRYYHPIYKNVIAAGRIAYAHSMGDMKVNYVMGGVDNWLFPKTAKTPPPPGQDFAFQTLTTNLRGYEQNARNGNTYGVINLEMRIPLITTFAHQNIQSTFLKNLQLVPFLDFGNAWNGLLPNASKETQYYTFVNSENNLEVKIEAPTWSSALGFGTGIRTMMLGYFMRLDAAWNIDGRVKPLWYFSIGTDF